MMKIDDIMFIINDQHFSVYEHDRSFATIKLLYLIYNFFCLYDTEKRFNIKTIYN